MALQLDGLDALMAPKSIAVVGASADPAKIGGRPLKFLRQNGFAGEIFPINPRHQEIQGLRAYSSLAEVHEPVDLALVSVPERAVVEAVRDCADAGVRAVTIFSAGFAEAARDGAAAQAEIAAIGGAANMRILGPNCLGSANRRDGVSASFAASEGRPRPEGNVEGVALVSQSGAVAAYCVLAGLDRGVNFDPWVSTGNECDIQLADCLAYLALDDDVRVVAAYMEGCRDGDRLREALALAYERNKPVVLLKAGRSDVGARAAASHTAALVGSEHTFNALAKQYNVCIASSLDDLMDLSYGLGFSAAPTGARTGLVTSSGGAGILMADAAVEAGLEIPELPAPAQDALREIWPAAGVGNPIDTTAQLVNDKRLLSRFLHTVLAQGDFDSLIVFLSYIGLIPDWSHAAVEALTEAKASFPESDISLAMLSSPPVRRSIESIGIRVFDDPTKAVRVIGRAVENARGFERPAPMRPSGVLVAGDASDGEILSEVESAQLLESAGIPVISRRHVRSASEAAEAYHELRGAVAVKAVSADIPHKTEAGAVALGISSPDEAAAAYTQVVDAAGRYAPSAHIDGALVSRMAEGGLETILGVANDPVFGPTVLFGLGGIFVESIRDVTVRLAPFTKEEAMRMITDIQAYPALQGARGGPARDLDALAEALATLSRFADEHRGDIATVDVNPFLVMPAGQGAVAVDALVVRRS